MLSTTSETMFPEGYFYILSRKNRQALDVYFGKTADGTDVIVWPQKHEDNNNQLWSYENCRLKNKNSDLVLDVYTSANLFAAKKYKYTHQKKSNPTKQSQEWIYDDGFICSKAYPNFVLEIKDVDKTKGGSNVILATRKENDNLSQLWTIEAYYEGTLSMASTAKPLHKKETFGQPSLGYAAEVGVPPELKVIPENNNITGVGKNVYATPTTNDSRLDKYGSFYGEGTTSAPAAQPGQTPSFNQYPPPPTSDSYPPAPPQAGPIPSPSFNSYPPPPQNNNGGYGAAPSYPPTHEQGGVYPPPPSSPNNYPQQYPVSGSVYPPAPLSPSNYQQQPYPPAQPSPSNYLNNNNNNSGYPPTYPPSNTGYPPTSPGFNQPLNMPGSNDYAYPPSGNNPPPMPSNRPPQDQYGYPSYPQ